MNAVAQSVCPETTALPCATSQEAAVWTATHDALKRGPGWDDPTLVRQDRDQVLGDLAYQVGHCLGCGSTLYRERPAVTRRPRRRRDRVLVARLLRTPILPQLEGPRRRALARLLRGRVGGALGLDFDGPGVRRGV